MTGFRVFNNSERDFNFGEIMSCKNFLLVVFSHEINNGIT